MESLIKFLLKGINRVIRMIKKIAYNKQIVGRKTVRDMQQRPVGINEPATLQLPPMSLDELSRLKELLADNNIEGGRVEIKEVGLPFEEVKKKIDEAIKFTKKQDKEKYEAEVSNLKAQIKEKDEIIKNLSKNYNQNIEELKNKVDDIFNRISVGRAIVSDEEIKGRPRIKDDVFIDPLDKDHKPKLDPHIKEASKISVDRNVIKDLAKLKNLLSKKKTN